MKFVPILKQRKVSVGRLTSTVVMALLLLMLMGCNLKQSRMPAPVVQPVSIGEQDGNDVATAQQWLLTGQNHESADENRLALMAYLKALTLNPDNQAALLAAAAQQLELGEQGNAAELYQRALDADPADVTALVQLGLINIARAQFESAQGYLQQAIVLSRQGSVSVVHWSGSEPTEKTLTRLQHRAYNALAVLADISGHYREAQRLYRKALRLSPNDREVINNRGYSHYLASRWQAAEQSYTEVLKLSPDYPPAWRNLGLLYARQGKYMEALQALSRLMTEAQAYSELSYICMLEGKYQRALYFSNRAWLNTPEPDRSMRQQRLKILQLMQSGALAGNGSDNNPTPRIGS